MSRRKQTWRGAGPTARGRRAFTLVELLVVLMVLALLAAVLAPVMSGAFETTYSTLCKGNLRNIAQAMHANAKDQPLMVPGPEDWPAQAVAYAGEDSLICIDDVEIDERPSSQGDLSNVYILQYHHDGKVTASYIEDILEGRPVPDHQIWIDKWEGNCVFASHCNCCWSPDELSENQHVIGVDASAAIKITLGATVAIESLDTCQHEGPGDPGTSRHFVKRGPANPPEEDAELLHLTGVDYYEVDPRSPSVVCGARTSYGMNASIMSRQWRPDQIMLMDANDITVEVELDVIAPRHRGRCNTVRVDQSVRTMDPVDLEEALREDAMRRHGLDEEE